MVVTDIKQQQRRKDRYSIYLDGKYGFSLGELQLIDAGLRVGDQLSTEQVAELEDNSEIGKALDRAYGYISLRERSRQEMAQYLRRKGYEDEVIEPVIERLEQADLVDDRRFAQLWVDDRKLLKPSSLTALRAELRQKGIAGSIIDEVLAAEADSEAGTLVQLVSRGRLLSRYPDPEKLTAYLMRKGFKYSAVKAAIEELENNDDLASGQDAVSQTERHEPN